MPTEAARKKTLSYIIRLCQPSFRLFQFVGKWSLPGALGQVARDLRVQPAQSDKSEAAIG